MKDPRIEKLAKIIVNYSLKLKAGEKLLIEAFDGPEDLTVAVFRQAVEKGAVPLISWRNNRLLRDIFRNATEESMKLIGDIEAYRMKQMDAYVGIRGSQNITEFSDVPDEKMKLYQKYWLKPVHLDLRVPKTRWVVMRYPTPSMAQQAGMSTEAFEDFYFEVCTVDYAKMSRAMEPLTERLQKADQIHILGPGTDLRFSKKGIPVLKGDGTANLPDGEIFTAPVRDSVNGNISYNAPSLYHGFVFDSIRFEFRDGKIVHAEANHTEKINEILDSDEGARYIGEFALGLNPKITRPMKDTLFDEKIAGSFHFTPGAAYGEADNGNRSEIHWDLVCIQTPEYGGGEIYFDGELIRKDGLFVPDDLQGLNPENLVTP